MDATLPICRRYRALWFCTICNSSFDGGIALHLGNHILFENICACSAEFELSYELLVHFSRTHIEKVYKCEDCNYITRDFWGISQHVSDHVRNFDGRL